MGNVLQKFIRSKEVYMIGLDRRSGKDAIVLEKTFTRIPSIGFKKGYNMVGFTSWGVAGREKARPLYRYMYHGKKAVIVVVDSNDTEKMEDIHCEMDRTLKEDKRNEYILVIIAYNQDLPNAMTQEKIWEALGLSEIPVKRWSCVISGTTADTHDGVLEVIDWISTTLDLESNNRKYIGFDDNENLQTDNDDKKDRSQSSVFINMFSVLKDFLMN